MLRQHRATDLSHVTPELRQRTTALACVGNAGKLLDGKDRRTGHHQHEADVDRQVADESVHHGGLRVHFGTRDEHAPIAELFTILLDAVEHHVRHVRIRLLDTHTRLIVDQQVAGIRNKAKALDHGIWHDQRSRIAAHGGVGKCTRLFDRVIDLRLELVAAQLHQLAFRQIHVIGRVDAFAQVARQHVAVLPDLDRVVPQKATQRVIFAHRHNVQPDRARIALFEPRGHLLVRRLADGVNGDRRLLLLRGAREILIDLNMLPSHVGDIDLARHLAGLPVDLAPLPVCIEVDRLARHGELDVVRLHLLRIGVRFRVVDIRLRCVDRVVLIQVLVHHARDRHAARHRRDRQEQDHGDHAHRQADGVDLGRQLAHGEHVEAAPIYAAHALHDADQDAGEPVEKQERASSHHDRRDTELLKLVVKLRIGACGYRNAIVQ